MENLQIQINNQQEMRIKTERNKGWVLMIYGILCTMWGLCWLFWGIYGYFDPPQDFSPSRMLLPALVIGMLGVLIGYLSLRYGIKRIKSANEMKDTGDKVYYGIKHLKMAWTLTIPGGFLSLGGMFFVVLAIYNLIIIPKTPDAISTGLFSLQCCFLALLFGSPFLLLGTWLIASGSRGK